jgi:uncharacterized protein with von Willebrand factor type A (vWA) domain
MAATDALPADPAARMVGFLRHLRANDFPLGPAETEAALRLIADRDWLAPERARLGLLVLLAARAEEWRRFDDLFEAYWHQAGRIRTRATPSPGAASSGRSGLWDRHLAGDAARRGKLGNMAEMAGEDEDADAGGTGRLIASTASHLRRTDLRHLTDPEEIRAAERLAFRLARALRYRLSRRYRAARKGARLDLRRTIRSNLAQGGEPMALIEQGRPDRPVRIVALLDVSGSMQPYARFFLQFLKGLITAWPESEAFLFHTRLVRVTDAVRYRDSIRAMSRLALMAEGFGGGTRLGASLQIFNRRYAKSAINSRTVFLVFSDGYDTGSSDDLVPELARLKKRVRRLVWLNPLLGWQDYQPINRAMTAALPFIDHFAAAHTLDDLAAIEPELRRL